MYHYRNSHHIHTHARLSAHTSLLKYQFVRVAQMIMKLGVSMERGGSLSTNKSSTQEPTLSHFKPAHNPVLFFFIIYFNIYTPICAYVSHVASFF
jgi:hypothetical protein